MSETQTNPTNEDIAARNMGAALWRLERQVPPPRKVLLHGEPLLRHVEQTIQRAMVVKLTRYIGMLNAARRRQSPLAPIPRDDGPEDSVGITIQREVHGLAVAVERTRG